MTRPLLTDDEHARLRALLVRVAGLVVDAPRREAVALSVHERVRRTGVAGVPAYLDLLEGSPQERQQLLDEVTVPETHFFRNPPQVAALRSTVVPQLLREAAARGDRRLRCWSAGCSTGEEPYTLAALLREQLPPGRSFDARVLGTDVSQRALAAAEQARYGERSLRLVGAAALARHFAPLPDGRWAVRPEVRALVELRHHNLVTEPVPAAPGELDLVLCRNVTIYFDRETTRALLGRLHDALRPGGWLLLGHAETLWQVSDAFTLVPVGSGDDAAFLYRRPAPGQRRSAPPASRAPVPAPALPPAAPPDPLLASRAALAAGEYARAADLAADVARALPLLAAARYVAGVALASLGRDAAAAVALRGAVYLAPDDGLARFVLAGVLARLGDRAAAAREYSAAADALVTAPPAPTAPELGGRSSAELAELCRRLADPGA